MKILLISPGTPDEIDNKIIRQIPYLFAKANNAPHAVATIAALTPPEHEVSIRDEYMHGPVEEFLPGKSYDIIGISVTSNQLKRSLQIAAACKKYCPSAIVVAGGIGVETLIYKNKEHIDVVFHGEAEDTWPRFLNDVKNRNYQNVYRSIIKPDLTKSPPPRWELLGKDIISYNNVLLQTTRGCPFDCSFCDVIYTYGRKPRSKTIPQVLEEIKRLQKLGVDIIFIADDNFAGDRIYVKKLLRQMIALNKTFKIPVGFFTQIDITIAGDEELLKLLADANFMVLMIGIESVNIESLKDMNKKQNLVLQLDDAVCKIQSYGMVILAHMIIGADSDNKDIFRLTAEFIQRNNIVFHICHPLAAPPGTKMWYEYKRQGRLVTTEHQDASDKLDIITNIIPKQMSRIELLEGLAAYWDDIYKPEKFRERAIGFLKGITYKPAVRTSGLRLMWHMRKMVAGVFVYFFFRAEKMHRKTFIKIVSHFKTRLPRMMEKIIFTYTIYLIDSKRSAYDAAVAREMAAWERENPSMVTKDTCSIPVPDNIRKHAASLIDEIYKSLRQHTADKETIYHAAVDVLMDFSDRFGNNFVELDEFYREQLKIGCESMAEKIKLSDRVSGVSLPEKQPTGFSREIMDALDNAVRYRNIYG